MFPQNKHPYSVKLFYYLSISLPIHHDTVGITVLHSPTKAMILGGENEYIIIKNRNFNPANIYTNVSLKTHIISYAY